MFLSAFFFPGLHPMLSGFGSRPKRATVESPCPMPWDGLICPKVGITLEYPLDHLGDERWVMDYKPRIRFVGCINDGCRWCFPSHFQLSNTWMEKSTMILRKIHPWTEGPKSSKSMVFQFDVDQGQERETSLCGLDTCAPWPCLPFGIFW